MTRVVYNCLYLETSASCVLCSSGEEDCTHIFFECPFARMLWNQHTIPRATPRRGDSPSVEGFRGIFPLIRPFFRPQLGDRARAHFRFWKDDWSRLGRLGDIFPRLYAQAPDPATTILTMWTGTWISSLPQALSDQRLDHFMSLQTRLAKLRLFGETQDAWL